MATNYYTVQRSTTVKPNALKKGDLVFGCIESDYGPTSTTGFINGINPPMDGFIFIENINNKPYLYSFDNEEELITWYNRKTNVGSFQDVLVEISQNSDECLIAGLNVDSGNIMGINQEAINLTSTPTALGQLLGLQSFSSDLVENHCMFWFSMVSTTIDYVAIYPGTIIEEVNGTTITSKLSQTSSPVRGSMSIVANRIYSSNKPVHLADQSANNYTIANMSYRGNILAGYGNRGFTATYRISCVEDNTTIDVFADATEGSNSEFIQRNTINKGDILSVAIDSSYDDRWIFAKSNKEIFGTVQHGSSDKFILPPVSTDYVYRRYNEYEINILGQTPSFVGTYVVQDNNGVAAVSIADGAGSEAEAGMPLNFLSNTYAFGSGELDSYFIVSPYTNTITVSYYSNNVWTQYDSHVENGSLTVPSVHSEGQQAGGTPLVPALGSVPWKFEGTNPFYIVVNDGSSDEEALIGWNRNDPIYAISY